MSRPKLISNLKTCQPIVQVRQLSSLSEMRQSNIKSKPTADASIKSDIVLIGDGVLANSLAYWLRASNPNNSESVTVIENEKFIQSKFNIPNNNQFNSVEAIQLSKFTTKFIRRLNAEFKLRPGKDNAQIKDSFSNDILCEQKSSIGLLQLSENLYGESELIKYNKIFKQLFGSTECTSELLNSKQLSEMFTWLNGENVRLARFHSRDDAALPNINLSQLNDVFKSKAQQLGVLYVKGSVKELKSNNKYEEDIYGVTCLRKNCNELSIDRHLSDSLSELTNIQFKKLILFTPAEQSRIIAKMLGLTMANQWPVEKRQRFIYEIKCKDLKNENIPVVVDSSGFWVKRDQSTGNFYCGFSSQENLPAEEGLNKVTSFSKYVWPRLLNYIPILKNIEIVNVHEQNYDYNIIDDNAIVGSHPDIGNIYWLLGFHGNHETWAPLLGKSMSELILTKRCNSINLNRFGWQRVLSSALLKRRVSN